jgi:hypothetical protein
MAWNSMLEAGQAYQQTKNSIVAAALTTSRSSTIIRVKNETGAVLDRCSVLGLGDPIFTPDDSTVNAFLREVTFRGVVPNIGMHQRKYCVLLEPAPVARVVRAVIAGVCPVLVDQQDEAHEYAGIYQVTTSKLLSSVHGHARILWREGLQGGGYGYADSGVQWAIVMLGVTGSSGCVGKAASTISAKAGTNWGSGHVDIYRDTDGLEDGPIETIQVMNVGTEISAGKWVAVEWDAWDTPFVGPLECEDPGYYF